MSIDYSIIIPAKNEEKFIEKSLNCIKNSLKKSKKIYEIILVDNGSTDTTKQIAALYGCKIIEMPDGNISKLRNIGAFHAKGNFLAFVDADCLVHEDWITTCGNRLKEDGIGLVGVKTSPELKDATWVERCRYKLGSASRPNYVNWIGSSNMVVKKEYFEKISGFNERLLTGEDVNFCFRLKKMNLKIFLEDKIQTIHLRESKTLKELFRREFWRGQSSLVSLINSEYPQKELMSVIVPGINLIFTFLFLFFALVESNLAIFFFMFIISFPLIFMTRKKCFFLKPKEFFQCFFVAFVFIYARSFALFMELFRINFKRNIDSSGVEN